MAGLKRKEWLGEHWKVSRRSAGKGREKGQTVTVHPYCVSGYCLCCRQNIFDG